MRKGVMDEVRLRQSCDLGRREEFVEYWEEEV